MFVIDTCAIIAILRAETGWQEVEKIFLQNKSSEFYIHSINLCEIYYDCIKVDGQNEADRLLEDLFAYFHKQRIAVYYETDLKLLKIAGQVKANNRLSLADSFVAALAIMKTATVITSDKKEFTPLVESAICNVTFFR